MRQGRNARLAAAAFAFALTSPSFVQAGDSLPATAGLPSDRNHAPSEGFVTAKGSKLDLNGEPFSFRGMNAPDLFDGRSEFRAVDTFQTFAGLGTGVTRTYIALQVKNDQWDGSTDYAHAAVVGYDSAADDWVYNEDWFAHCDVVLDAARQYGIKLIIPFVNQDNGDATTNWKGNFVDLIRYRHNISSYAEAQQIDWWSDPTMRSLFKKAIAKMLTRVNTRNGVVWGKDDSVLAWETGNEMNQATQNNTVHLLPAPANWTLDIAEFTKSLAPNTLLIDGSFSRSGNATTAWPIEVLQSKSVDMFSYHFYGDGDIALIEPLAKYVESFGKVFVNGESGFYSSPAKYVEAYDLMTGAGALVWAFRPHAENGGFVVHSEGNGYFSYHFPGWKKQTDPMFDPMEYDIVKATFEASFNMVGKEVPRMPTPGMPTEMNSTNVNGTTSLVWRGAAWAEHYELWAAPNHGEYRLVLDHILDNVEAGKFSVSVPSPKPATPTVAVSTAYQRPSSTAQVQRRHQNGGRSLHKAHKNYHKHRQEKERREAEKAAEGGSHTARGIDGAGTWYIARGVAVDGATGPFSTPLYVADA